MTVRELLLCVDTYDETEQVLLRDNKDFNIFRVWKNGKGYFVLDDDYIDEDDCEKLN